MKRVFKIIGGVALLVVVGGSGFVALNWTFLSRALTYPKNPVFSVDWYSPMEVVKGSSDQTTSLDSTKTDLIPPKVLREIENYAQEHNSSSLLILHKGKLITEKYWKGHERDSLSNSMSMSKTIVSLLIGIAISEGHIQSEKDPVSNYIPEWKDDERSSITIEDLLLMQSGLRDYEKISDPFSDLVKMYMGTNAKEDALSIPFEKKSGQSFQYTNANSQILAAILEQSTGERYSNYLSSRLWQPIGASDAKIWLDREGGNAKTFCCLFTTSKDWVKIGNLFLNEGQNNREEIVSKSWIEKMLNPSKLEPAFGYNIWLKALTKSTSEYRKIASEPFLSDDLYYINGLEFQRVYIIPSHDLVIVRIGAWPKAWDDAFIPNTLVKNLNNDAVSASN